MKFVLGKVSKNPPIFYRQNSVQDQANFYRFVENLGYFCDYFLQVKMCSGVPKLTNMRYDFAVRGRT